MNNNNLPINAFLKSRINAKEKTLNSYSKAINTFTKWAENNGIAEFSTETIRIYRSALLKEGKTASTINAYMSALKGLAEYLNSNGSTIKTEEIRFIRQPTEPLKDALTIGQARQLIALDLKLRDRAIIKIMLGNGLRTCEISRLNYGNLKNKAGKTVLYVTGKGKETASDYTVLTPETEKILNGYLAARGRTNDEEPLFLSQKGGRLTAESVSRIVKNALRQIGINSGRITAHSLRHTAITFSLIAGCTIREAQNLARHSSVTTTERYAHEIDKLSGKTVNAIESLLTDTPALGTKALTEAVE